MLLARAPRHGAEAARKALARQGLVRKDRRIFEDGADVLLPLSARPDDELVARLGIAIEEGDADEREFRRAPQELVAEAADIPDELKIFLPRRWERVGDIVTLRMPPELEPHARKVAAAYAQALGARVVVRETGLISGRFRQPEIEALYGSGTETVHLENGIRYELDVARLMFSSGNIDEKLRLAALDCRGERVVDMFAGIGYFTLPLAVHAKAAKIIACEINPVAAEYLRRNIARNNVQDVVEVFQGDNRDLPGEGIADRVVMGYVRTTSDHLDKAFSLVRDGGWIHYQDTFPLEVFPEMAYENVRRAAGARGHSIELVREIKSYSPGVSHMALDIKVG